jgi:argininosuccinate lyase
LGAGALAGTSFPIDRELTTKLLGFQKVMPHGHDATSSRDFMLEVLSSISILQTTISRYAEELIFFSSYEFQTVTLDDGFAMGSSMMPQKKNPGSVELLRGRTGRINGLLSAGLTLMKGLPSAYNRDFHEEKEILFEALDLILGTTSIIPELTRTITFNLKRMHELAYGNFATATEVANFLVAKNNVPFRQAHHIVGSLVGELSRSGRNFRDWEACVDWIINKNGVKADPNELKKVFDPKHVMMTYNSLGGTGPIAVKKMIEDFNKDLERHKKTLEEDKKRTEKAFNVVRELATKAGSVKSAQELLNLVPQEYRTKKQ